MTAMTTARRNYDDEAGASQQASEQDAPKKPAAPRAKARGFSVLQSLLLAGGSAVAAVVAVDWYRKVFKGGGDEEQRGPAQAPAAIPATPMQQQTFVPMPMPFPMPMPMYGGSMPAPPTRNRESDEEETERDLLRRMKKDREKAKVLKEMQRRRIEDLADDFLED